MKSPTRYFKRLTIFPDCDVAQKPEEAGLYQTLIGFRVSSTFWLT